jgi:ketosteroid isomerase-like protein
VAAGASGGQAPPAQGATSPAANSAGLGKLADDYTDSLNTADIERFSRFFAADATMFFPLGALPLRLENKDQIVTAFKAMFDAMHQRGSGPRFMNMVAGDLKVQQFGDAAVVTFQVKEGSLISRRTLVLARRAGAWLIVHVHGSNVQVPES